MQTFEVDESYSAHKKEVTDIWVLHNQAIVSSSKDKTIYLKKLNPNSEMKEGTVDIGFKLEELLAVTVINNKLLHTDLTCAIGTAGGKMLIYSAENRFSSYDVVIDKPEEGCVNLVMYQFGILVWANKANIYMKHFDRDQNIC